MKCLPALCGALAVLGSSWLLLGCSDLLPVEGQGEGGGDATGTGEYPYEAEEGTCNGWKVRYCEAFVQCGMGSLDECIFETEYVQCKDGNKFANCENKLKKVINKDDCSLFPDDCGPPSVADRTAASALCEDFYQSVCEFDYFCLVVVSPDICVDQLKAANPCSNFTSVVPGGEACPGDVDVAQCGDTLPDSCMDFIRRAPL